MLRLDKKGISLIVSYVLLISIGLSIAGLVYGWLRFYVDIEDVVKCPDGVSLIIIDSSYYQAQGGGSLSLNLTLQNKGRFNIDGYVVRINNRPGATTGTYKIYDSRDPVSDDTLSPGNSNQLKFNSTILDKHTRICFVEVQPFIKDEKNQTVPCDQVSTRKIDCS